MDVSTFKNLPINIDLLRVNDSDLTRIEKINTGAIFDNSTNFHPQGLFSTTVFGAVGSEFRSRRFGYIDLGITILHPLVYYAAINLKAFYKQIAEGKTLALFDPKTKSFEKSVDATAQTGYHFFISHVHELKFEKNESDKRNFLIDLFDKAVKEGKHTMRYVLVLPAGLRDYYVDPDGKPQEDEINTFYRKLISQSAIVDPVAVKKSPEVYDNVASGLQDVSLELFVYLKSLLEGKHKLVLGKWLSRKIFNSTRNVLSSSIDKTNSIDDINRLRYNECQVGIHQFARACVPKSLYEIKNKYIKSVFVENTTTAVLTNAKTLRKEEVLNSHIQKDYELWTSSQGLEKVIASLGNLNTRNFPVLVNKGRHYLGLVYRDEKYFKFFQDITELPDGFDKTKVTPVTLGEMVYMSLYHLNGKYPGMITRYPITGYGSIYPCYVKLATTMSSFTLEELDDEWKPSGNIASSFPDATSDYFNTCSVHPSHLGALSADFDGDTVSLTMCLSDESIQEITDYLDRKEYYINDSGSFSFSNSTDTLDTVLAYIT